MESHDDEKVDAVTDISPDTSPDPVADASDASLTILYITLALIILAIGIWIIVLMFSKEDSIRILEAMKASHNQLTPVKDT